LLDEAYTKGLKIEHGADVWFGPAGPAGLKTDQELRDGLIERKRRTWRHGRLLEMNVVGNWIAAPVKLQLPAAFCTRVFWVKISLNT
jgi:hypothetical protein